MTTISQRQLRNDSGSILRRAAAGEPIRVRTGDVAVDLVRAELSVVERLTANGQLTVAADDDFRDFEPPPAGTRSARGHARRDPR